MSKKEIEENAFRYATVIFVLIALVSLISGLICLEDDNYDYAIVLIVSFILLVPISIWTYYHPFYPVFIGLLVYLLLGGVFIYSPINENIKFNFDGVLKYFVVGLGVIGYALVIGYKEWQILKKGESTVLNETESVPLEKQYRSNQQRAKAAIYLVGIVMGIEIVSLFFDLFQYKLLNAIIEGGVVSETIATLNDACQRITAIVYLIAYIVSAYTFIRWFRRAYYNLHQKVKKVLHDESWAVGSWFVPIISLYRPFNIMQELFQKTEKLLSNGIEEYRVTGKFVILNWWWGFWILSNILGQFVLRYTNSADTIEKLMFSTIASIVSSIIGIVLAIITIIVIKKYSSMELLLENMQEEKLDKQDDTIHRE
jgi:hypothetical protein